MMKFRKPLFFLALVIILVMFCFIKVPVIDNRLSGYNVDNNPYETAGERLAELFAAKDLVHVMVIPDSVQTGVVFDAIESLENELISAFPNIRVESLHKASLLLYRFISPESYVFEMLKMADRLPVTHNLVGRDTSSFLVIVYADRVDGFDPDRFDTIIQKPRFGFRAASAISLFHIQLQTEKSIRRDYMLILPLILLFVMSYLYYSYRNPGALLFSAVNIIFSVVSVFFFYSVMKVNINQITATAIAVVIILSLSVSVHLLTGFSFHAPDIPVAERIRETFRLYLYPTMLTTLTTVIAFASFFLSNSLYIRQFGLVTACSLCTAYFQAYFAAPFLLGLIKDKSQKPSLNQVTLRIQSFIIRNNRMISFILILILFISCFFISRITFRTNLETFIPRHTPVYKNYQEIRKSFFSLAELDLLIEAGEGMPDSIKPAEQRRSVVKTVGDLSLEISSWPEVNSVQSIKDQMDFESRIFMPGIRIALFPRIGNPFVSKDQNKYRINVKLNDSGDIWKVITRFEKSFSPYKPLFKYSVYSDFLFFHYISSRVTSSMLKSLLLSAFLIFMILFLLTRSASITAAGILANIIPLGFLILILAVFSIDLNITTSVTMIVCLGLIVDDTIHILYRMVRLNEPMQELSIGVLKTSFILTGGFSLFLLSQSRQIQLFGILNALVFLIAVISDLAIMTWLLNKILSKRQPPSV